MYKKKFYQANEWIKSLANVFSKEIPLISQLNWHSEIGLEDEEFFSNYPNMDIFVLIKYSLNDFFLFFFTVYLKIYCWLLFYLRISSFEKFFFSNKI